jgi:hypothetical protein
VFNSLPKLKDLEVGFRGLPRLSLCFEGVRFEVQRERQLPARAQARERIFGQRDLALVGQALSKKSKNGDVRRNEVARIVRGPKSVSENSSPLRN